MRISNGKMKYGHMTRLELEEEIAKRDEELEYWKEKAEQASKTLVRVMDEVHRGLREK